MTPDDFKHWRAAAGFKSRPAAAASLGVSVGSIILYETGVRRDNGAAVEIPKTVALACAAVLAGLPPYGE